MDQRMEDGAEDLHDSLARAQAMINSMGHVMQEATPLVQQNAQLQAQIDLLSRQVQALTAQAQSLVTPGITPSPSPAPDSTRIAPPPPRPTPSMKAKAPKPFSGEDRSTLEVFLSQCRLVFMVNPESFPSEQQKVLYSGSYLEGIAYAWFEPLLRRYDPDSDAPLPHELSSFKSFSVALAGMFGDPDLVKTKTRELRALRQTSSVTIYASEFQRLRAFISWNDQAFYDQFYDGLRENVKDGLANAETKPTTLEELIRKAQTIDNRIAERISEKRSAHSTASLPPGRKSLVSDQPRPVATAPTPWRPTTAVSRIQTPTPSQPHVPAFTADGTTPMELDAGRRGGFRPKLTPEQLEYRKVNNLCTYCGGAGHYSRECPEKAAAELRKAQYNQRRLALASAVYAPPSELSVNDELLSEKSFAQE